MNKLYIIKNKLNIFYKRNNLFKNSIQIIFCVCHKVCTFITIFDQFVHTYKTFIENIYRNNISNKVSKTKCILLQNNYHL